MALSDDLNTLVQAAYLPEIQRSWVDEDLILQKMWKAGSKLDGGSELRQVCEYQFTKGHWYKGTQPHDISGEKHWTHGKFEWRMLEIPMVLPREEIIKINGKHAFKNILTLLKDAAKARFMQMMVQAAYGGGIDSSPEPNGFNNLFDDAAGTLTNDINGAATTVCGTLDRATDAPWWAGNVKNGAAANLSQALLTQTFAKAVRSGQQPDLVGMGVNSFYFWLNSLQSQQQFLNAKVAEAGFWTAVLHGRMVVADRNILEYGDANDHLNRVYFWNTKKLDIVSHQMENMRFDPFQKPLDRNALVGHIYHATAFTTSDPRLHAVLRDFRVGL